MTAFAYEFAILHLLTQCTRREIDGLRRANFVESNMHVKDTAVRVGLDVETVLVTPPGSVCLH